MKLSKPLCFKFLLFALLGSLPIAVLGRAVVGIDLGATNVRMGMLRSGVGSVEVVLSFESDRKTICAVGYRDGQTLFSQTAMNMFPKFPKNVFCRLNMLLGKLFSSPSVSSYASAFTHNLSADPARGTVLIEEPVHKKLVPVEQFTATFFSHLLEQAQKHAGFPVVDAVIAVPAYFRQWERQAVLDAAKIAGFNVLSLINGPSAAAFFKITTENDLKEPGNFIIFDSGSGGTSATLVYFDPKKEADGVSTRAMEVKAVVGDEGLGGDLIDDRIAEFLRQKFEAAHPGTQVTAGKPYNKVLVEASRIKRILNTNDYVSASLEDLIDELSLSIPRLQRETIEVLLADLADRFVAPIKKVLSDAGMSDLSGINSILMIGGNSRQQFVLKALKSAFGSEKLSVTLDPDEAIVKGATLFAAKLHPAFRLRPVHFLDVSPDSIAVEYSKLMQPEVRNNDLFALPWADDKKLLELFPSRSALAGRKSLTLKHHDSLLAELKTASTSLARVAVSGFDAAVASVATPERTIISSKLRIPVQLTLSGQVVIETPVAVVEYEEAVAVPQEPIAKEEEPKKPEAADQTAGEQKDETVDAVDGKGKTDASKDSNPKQAAVKKFTKTLPLKFNIQYRVPPMSDDAIKGARAMIDAAKAEELKKVALATVRNDLEQSVYHWQAEVSSIWFSEFANKNEKSQMTKAVSKASNLLNDKKAAQQEDPSPYQRVLNEIQGLESAVKQKQTEWEGRASAVETLQKTFAQVHEFLIAQQSIPADERAVTDVELSDLKADLEAAEKWSTETVKKQSSLSKHDQPVLLIADILKRSVDLSKFLFKLKAKKKPIKPVESKKPEEPENKESSQNANENGDKAEPMDEAVSEHEVTKEQLQDQKVPVQEKPDEFTHDEL